MQTQQVFALKRMIFQDKERLQVARNEAGVLKKLVNISSENVIGMRVRGDQNTGINGSFDVIGPCGQIIDGCFGTEIDGV